MALRRPDRHDVQNVSRHEVGVLHVRLFGVEFGAVVHRRAGQSVLPAEENVLRLDRVRERQTALGPAGKSVLVGDFGPVPLDRVVAVVDIGEDQRVLDAFPPSDQRRGLLEGLRSAQQSAVGVAQFVPPLELHTDGFGRDGQTAGQIDVARFVPHERRPEGQTADFQFDVVVFGVLIVDESDVAVAVCEDRPDRDLQNAGDGRETKIVFLYAAAGAGGLEGPLLPVDADDDGCAPLFGHGDPGPVDILDLPVRKLAGVVGRRHDGGERIPFKEPFHRDLIVGLTADLQFAHRLSVLVERDGHGIVGRVLDVLGIEVHIPVDGDLVLSALVGPEVGGPTDETIAVHAHLRIFAVLGIVLRFFPVGHLLLGGDGLVFVIEPNVILRLFEDGLVFLGLVDDAGVFSLRGRDAVVPFDEHVPGLGHGDDGGGVAAALDDLLGVAVDLAADGRRIADVTVDVDDVKGDDLLEPAVRERDVLRPLAGDVQSAEGGVAQRDLLGITVGIGDFDGDGRGGHAHADVAPGNSLDTDDLSLGSNGVVHRG